MNYKLILFLLGVLLTFIAVKAFGEPIFVEVKDAKTCTAYNKVAPCLIRCGNFKFRKEVKQYLWRDCPGLMKLFTAPGPEPTPKPIPTSTPNPFPTATCTNPCDCGTPGWCLTWIPETDTTLCARCAK